MRHTAEKLGHWQARQIAPAPTAMGDRHVDPPLREVVAEGWASFERHLQMLGSVGKPGYHKVLTPLNEHTFDEFVRAWTGCAHDFPLDR